jgi:hypothetical protein
MAQALQAREWAPRRLVTARRVVIMRAIVRVADRAPPPSRHLAALRRMPLGSAPRVRGRRGQRGELPAAGGHGVPLERERTRRDASHGAGSRLRGQAVQDAGERRGGGPGHAGGREGFELRCRPRCAAHQRGTRRSPHSPSGRSPLSSRAATRGASRPRLGAGGRASRSCDLDRSPCSCVAATAARRVDTEVGFLGRSDPGQAGGRASCFSHSSSC